MRRRASKTTLLALAGALITAGLVGATGTASAALPTFQHDRDVVFFDFGETTDPSTKLTPNGAEITDGVPFTEPATPDPVTVADAVKNAWRATKIEGTLEIRASTQLRCVSAGTD